MTQTHWKRLTNPEYLGAYSLEPGKDLTLTIKSVVREMVTGTDGKKEECTIIKFMEQVKPMICNNTNAKMIEKIYKTPYIEEWAGRAIQIYVEHGIKVGRETTDGLRIRPIIPKQSAPVVPVCADCNDPVEAEQGGTAQQIAEASQRKYGKVMCKACREAEKSKRLAPKIIDPLFEQGESGTDE